ncbi:unnamed protein product [Hydatigera taeniaeformis]|uniref:Uncharacterized protein n=1 Tax=Hydatigena taeniaeformis TaxID=6205 RepID=A0A3P7F6J1_HYDTA|nr:unnamed protein product [Hydatigera taeniaeformis]
MDDAVDNKEEPQKEAVDEEKKGSISATTSPTTTGPWTTSRWQADDESEKDATTSELNASTKISSVKLALGSSLETMPAVPVSIDMDMSDNESAPKVSTNPPVNESKGGSKAPMPEAPVDSKISAPVLNRPQSRSQERFLHLPPLQVVHLGAPRQTLLAFEPGAGPDHFAEEDQVDAVDEAEVQVVHVLVVAAASVVGVIISVLAPAAVVIAVAVALVVVKAHGVEGRGPTRIDRVVGGTALRIHVDVDARTPRIPVHRAVHTRPCRVIENQWLHHRELACDRSCG